MKHDSVVPAVRILLIEDNVSDAFLLDLALKKQHLRFELIHLVTGGAAMAFIRRQGAYAEAAVPNLILVDLNLSKYTGEDILREIRSATSPGRRSDLRVELFPALARRRLGSRTSEFPNSSPSLPVWINSWRSAKPSSNCSQVPEPLDGGSMRTVASRKIQTAIQFIQLAYCQPLGPGTTAPSRLRLRSCERAATVRERCRLKIGRVRALWVAFPSQ